MTTTPTINPPANVPNPDDTFIGRIFKWGSIFTTVGVAVFLAFNYFAKTKEVRILECQLRASTDAIDHHIKAQDYSKDIAYKMQIKSQSEDLKIEIKSLNTKQEMELQYENESRDKANNHNICEKEIGER